MRREWRERFPPPPRFSVPDMHHGTCVTQVPWCMPGSLTSGFLWSWWRGKCSRHSRRMRNPRFCVSGKRPMGFAGLLKRLTSPYTAYNLDITTLKFSHVNKLYISQSYLYDILCGIFEIYPKYLTHVSDDIIFYPKLNFCSATIVTDDRTTYAVGPPLMGPFTRYVKFRVAHASGMQGTFSSPPTSMETVS